MGQGVSMPLSPSALAALRHIVLGDPKKLFSFSLTGESMAQLAGAAEGFLMTQLERGFRTLDYYKQLRLPSSLSAGTGTKKGDTYDSKHQEKT
jgi:DNA repair protein RecO (recombination protein O)